MSDEREYALMREFDDFRLRVMVMKEIIEDNFYDPVFGVITHHAVVDELRSLLNHFGYELVEPKSYSGPTAAVGMK